MPIPRTARSIAQGRYAPSAPTEADVTIVPRTGATGRTGIVYLHGRSGSAFDVTDPRQRRGVWDIVQALADRWPLVAADLAGQGTWGHPTTQQARTADAIDYLRRPEPVEETDPPGVGADPDAPVVLVGTSMGGLGAYLYAMNHPEEVACVVGITPVVDLDSVRQTGFAAAEINAVWGVPNNATPLPAGSNPATQPGALLAPTAMWYSSGDTIVLPATVTAFAAAVGGTATLVGSMAHEDVADGIDPDDVVAFVASRVGG